MAKKSEKDPLKPTKWWMLTKEDGDPCDTLLPMVRKVFNEQSWRYTAYKQLSEAYGADLTSRGQSMNPMTQALNEDNIVMNELTNTIETLHSQIYKNRILPA